jgi:general secretion pathway protein G
VRGIRRFAYGAGGALFVILWLSVIAVWSANSEMHHAKPVVAKANIATFRKALALFANDVGNYPSAGQGLQALRTNPGEAKWRGPYLREDPPVDPWGRAYIYRIGERGMPEIVSFGRDGRAGGRGEDSDTSSLHLDAPTPQVYEEAHERLMEFAVLRIAPACFLGYLIAPSIVRAFRRNRRKSARAH